MGVALFLKHVPRVGHFDTKFYFLSKVPTQCRVFPPLLLGHNLIAALRGRISSSVWRSNIIMQIYEDLEASVSLLLHDFARSKAPCQAYFSLETSHKVFKSETRIVIFKNIHKIPRMLFANNSLSLVQLMFYCSQMGENYQNKNCPQSQYRMWELKIHVILYLIQNCFLTNYIVENAENSISKTLDFISDPSSCSRLRARFCEHHLKNSIFLVPPLEITLRRPCVWDNLDRQ